MNNRFVLAAIALIALCGVSDAQITSGKYIMGNGQGIATVSVTAPNPTSGNYTVTVTDANGGTATTSTAVPTGNKPGEVESFNEMTTYRTDPETGELVAGITVRGKNGYLSSKTGNKWKRAKKKPVKKDGDETEDPSTESPPEPIPSEPGGGSGGSIGTTP